MASINEGKADVVQWVKENFPAGATCLDVGACDGKWFNLLGDYLTMDAVEIYGPNCEKHRLSEKYRKVLCADIADCNWYWYDLIIFGDVIEHMPVETAQKVLAYARRRCSDMIVAVPFLYRQGKIGGNPWERHIQDDLTPEIFAERYPGFKPLVMLNGYAYYTLDKDNGQDRNKYPRFSVICPTHNGADRLPVSLGSVKQQTYDNYELIVVCDSCTDHSADVARSYGANVITVNCERDGLARNAGIDAATGDWILFLDDDDWFFNEHAFAMLADEIRNLPGDEVDAIDFSFFWKSRGYIRQTPEFHCSMPWCRAYRSGFFADGKRYNSLAYGSDSSFFDRYINVPGCRIHFTNLLMYYYNYNREGSLSWMLENDQKPYLDVVITRHNEPLDVGLNLFRSLAIQECFHQQNVRIKLIDTGDECLYDLENMFPELNLEVVRSDARNVSAARNVGLDRTIADWVMFIDFDDALADIATMSMLTNVFPVTDDVNMIWCKYIRESLDYGRSGNTMFNREQEMDYRIIGKLYRTAFLRENNIRFDEQFPVHSSYIFNETVIAYCKPSQIRAFWAEFYPFFKKFRPDGAFSTFESIRLRESSRFDRDVNMAEFMRDRGLQRKFRTRMFTAVADAYYTIQSADVPPDENRGITDAVVNLWSNYKNDILQLSETDREVLLDFAETEAMTYVQSYYNHHQKEYYLRNDDISFDDFTAMLDDAVAHAPAYAESPVTLRNGDGDEVAVVPDKHAEIAKQTGKRAVVYCGTKETYVNMVASVKSLLANTPVDKVFFLIEDDEFPYEIPDIVETRNVKNIHPFTPDGPNYNNVWTYMCLMRTAFPDMFPEYDRILSLDIDVVIMENVSELWDIDLSDYYIAGVEENGHTDGLYVNFGVILMNLDKLRRDGMSRKLIDAVNTEKFGCPEQDAFNKYCAGHILKLPDDYNCTVYSHITGEPMYERILHYAGLKYWKHFTPVKKYFHLTWDEIMQRQDNLHAQH